jgi:REP element-mobilizing transposase RayT
MTQARSDVVTPGVVAYYHCYSRCVRRAFLCGYDAYSGRDYEHRRGWIEDRLKELVECFAIDDVSCAILENHLHTLLKTRPDIAQTWSNEEVVRRWFRLFPRRPLRSDTDDEADLEQQVVELASNEEKVARYRRRLSCVSWFNRCLNEHIARRANAEDEVTGRFWEGRFKCKLLKNSAAVLACSVYVDLNPIRAGIATTPETSDYTSIQQRIRAQVAPGSETGPRLLDVESAFGGRISPLQYIQLVDETGRALVEGKQSISPTLAPILERLGLRSDQWLTNTIPNFPALFRRVVGTAQEIREHAKEKGRSWFQGLQASAIVFAHSPGQLASN